MPGFALSCRERWSPHKEGSSFFSRGIREDFSASQDKVFASLHIPRPALQALLIKTPGLLHQPVVVLDQPKKTTTSKRDQGKFRVVEVSSEAIEFGIHQGMTAVQAQARCDNLLLLNRSPKAEAALTEALLECASQFTPDFENTQSGTCLLDIGGVAAVEREAIQIAQQLHERISEMGYCPQVGVATNPDLALLAARACDLVSRSESGIMVLHPGDLDRVLPPLPVSLLNLTPEMVDLLELWGIRTLGEFSRLNRADLVARLGQDAGKLWDQSTGKARRLLRLFRPAVDFSAAIDLEYEETTLAPLVVLLQRLLDTVASRLQAAYLVAARLSLRLTLADGSLYQRVFRIPEPCTDVEKLLGIIQVHLAEFEARAPVTGILLRAIPARPGKHQFDLFAAGVKDPNRLSETLGRVEALLGSERFGIPRMRPTHRPDSFEMRPVQPGHSITLSLHNSITPIMNRLPMRLYRPRRHVQVRRGIREVFPAKPRLNRVQSTIQQGIMETQASLRTLYPVILKEKFLLAGDLFPSPVIGGKNSLIGGAKSGTSSTKMGRSIDSLKRRKIGLSRQ